MEVEEACSCVKKAKEESKRRGRRGLRGGEGLSINAIQGLATREKGEEGMVGGVSENICVCNVVLKMIQCHRIYKTLATHRVLVSLKIGV